MKSNYTYVCLTDNSDTYIGMVPELPGIVAEGETPEQLKLNIGEAITAYIELAEKEKLLHQNSLKLVKVDTVEVEHE